MSLLIESAIKVAAIVLAAFAATALMRRQSAALRHWVLAAALASAAVLPLLMSTVPSWHAVQAAPLVRLTAAATFPAGDASASPVRDVDPSAGMPSRTASVVMSIWLAGAAGSLAVLLIGFVRLLWIASRCRLVTDEQWNRLSDDVSREYELRRPIALLQSDHPALLVTWGLAVPKIILPAGAAGWSAERMRIVLYHELAHIRRGDWAVQLLAEIVRSAYWFNPLMWMACKRLRQESEHACDDAVLAGGVKGPDYAAQLLELATILNRTRQWLPAPAMARPSSLERRVAAMLNPRTNRRSITRFARLTTVAALVAITLPVASLAQQTFSSLSGSILDQSDALLPATKVVLTNTQTKAKYEVASDRTGRFEFVGLPSGSYALETALPGFASAHATLTIAGQDVQQNVKLQVASLEETVTVTDGPGVPRGVQTATRRALPACSSAPVAGGIGGNIRAPMRLRNADPIYPANVAGATPDEVVVLAAHIRPDGTMGDIEVVGSPNPAFAAAAMDAVRQWEYDETLLNCVPIEVSMKVTVRFRAARTPEK